MIDFTLDPSTVVFGSQQHTDMLAATDIDLSAPDYICTFRALILPGNGDTYAVAMVTADAAELVRLCQLSMVDVLGAADQQFSPLPVDGVYDCETSAVMIRVAELMGQDVGLAAGTQGVRLPARAMRGLPGPVQAGTATAAWLPDGWNHPCSFLRSFCRKVHRGDAS